MARRLVQGFGWPEAFMTTFVLTDRPPDRPNVLGYTTRYSTVMPSMNWVELRVLPLAVAPRDLETIYRRIRSEAIGGERVRSLSEKTAALAVFWEETWELAVSDRRVQWNSRYPDWAYPDPRGNFSRDAREAFRKVTGLEGAE